VSKEREVLKKNNLLLKTWKKFVKERHGDSQNRQGERATDEKTKSGGQRAVGTSSKRAQIKR